MGRSLLHSVVLAAVAVAVSGCGTVCNLAWIHVQPDGLHLGPPDVYGGLENDMTLMTNLKLNAGSSPSAGKGAVAGLAAGVTDIGLSYLGDTLSLPITATLREVRERALGISDAEKARLAALLAEDSAGAAGQCPPEQAARVARTQ
jgi:hypothetical protein